MPKKRPNLTKSGPPLLASSAHNDSLPIAPLVVLAGLILLELFLYYCDAPDLHLKQRWSSLNFLSAPDELFVMWCGGKIANFSLLDRWPIVLLTGLILLGAWLAGSLSIAAIGLTRLLTQLEQHVFALAAGLNLLSLYALAIGLAGGLHHRWLFLAPLIALAAIFIWQRLTRPAQMAHAEPHELVPVENDARWLWCLLVAAPFAAALFLGSMLPPWDYDVREYHLQSPKEWFQSGRISFLPHNIYANMPLGSELLSVWAMSIVGGRDGWWWGALAGKTVMACYSLIAAAGLIAFGQRLHSLAAGVLAAVIFLSAPWILSLGEAGLNEGPVAMYAILALFALWFATSSTPSAGSKPAPGEPPTILPLVETWRFIALAGFLAGSAVSCKYPPALFLVIPLAVWLAIQQFHRLQSPWWAQPAWWFQPMLHIFLCSVFLACGLWFAKNWVQTNNPTYPLLYSAFDGRTRTPAKDAQWKKVHSPQPDATGRRFPISDFFRELAWNGWRTRWASLLMPPLALAALFAKRQRPSLSAIALWMAFVFCAWWLSTHRLDRFLVLLLPAGALAAGIGAVAVPHPVWRISTVAFIALGAAAQFVFVTIHPDNRYFAPLERLRRDDRDLGGIGLRVESAHRWLNEHGQPGEKVLLLGDAEPFDLEIPAVYNTCFDDCQFTRIFKGRTRSERLATLRNEKIAYVFCSWTHLARYRSPGNYGYTSDYPTRQVVHDELIRQQHLLEWIDVESDPAYGELFRVARD
jgi:hypothetical protein